MSIMKVMKNKHCTLQLSLIVRIVWDFDKAIQFVDSLVSTRYALHVAK